MPNIKNSLEVSSLYQRGPTQRRANMIALPRLVIGPDESVFLEMDPDTEYVVDLGNRSESEIASFECFVGELYAAADIGPRFAPAKLIFKGASTLRIKNTPIEGDARISIDIFALS